MVSKFRNFTPTSPIRQPDGFLKTYKGPSTIFVTLTGDVAGWFGVVGGGGRAHLTTHGEREFFLHNCTVYTKSSDKGVPGKAVVKMAYAYDGP